MTHVTAQKRKWHQFSLSTLLVLMTLVSGLCWVCGQRTYIDRRSQWRLKVDSHQSQSHVITVVVPESTRHDVFAWDRMLQDALLVLTGVLGVLTVLTWLSQSGVNATGRLKETNKPPL